MSALVKNGDLVPSPAGLITKQQTFDALLRVGISEKVAMETTDTNFDHIDSLDLNVRRSTFAARASGMAAGPARVGITSALKSALTLTASPASLAATTS